MGNCLGTPREGERPVHESEGDPALGKNQKLSTAIPQWTSDDQITAAELRARRAEFWDTSPAFEGRKEIWEALKAACDACENQDFTLAQAIVNGAGISLPRGTLGEVYDELGNRYCVPNYCLAYPPSLAKEPAAAVAAAPQADASALNTESSRPVAGAEAVPAQDIPAADKVTLKIRLSTLKDVRLPVKKTDTFSAVASKLGTMESFDGSRVRFFMTGKKIPDHATVESLDIPKGFFIQAHVPSTS